MRLLVFLSAMLASAASSAQTSFINEIHYDNQDTDTGEAIEVVVPAGTDASGFTVVLYRGSDGAVYDTDPLGALVATADGKDIYVINYPENGIRNWTSGVALVDGTDVLQFISYEGTVTATDGPASGMTSADIGVFENQLTQPGESLQLGGIGYRYPDFEWKEPAASTFGALNRDGSFDQVFTYDDTQPVFEKPGWRLLAPPGAGVTVEDLAGINLVQGVVGQYPGADPNLFLTYKGGGTSGYGAATDATDKLPPGAGFMWYWFDDDFGPFSGGTSRSVALDGFALDATPAFATDINADVTLTLPFNAVDDFYMLGNPFNLRFEFKNQNGTNLTSPNATVSSSYLVYDPALGTGSTGATSGGYIELSTGDHLAPWQGVFVQATGTGGSDPEFTFSRDGRNVRGAELYARQSRPTTVALTLEGELNVQGVSVPVVDAVTKVRFRDDATPGFDRHDLSELAPPDAHTATLALLGVRNGAPHRQGVLSLPDLSGSVTVPVHLSATAEGTFVVTGELVSVPAGWSVALRDLATGASADLVSGASLTFTTDGAVGWSPRFELHIAASAVGVEGGAATAEVGQLAPNPASGQSWVRVRVGARQRVGAKVYDALGRVVSETVAQDLQAGAATQVSLDVTALAAGVYVVRIAGETFSETRQLTVVR